MEMGVILSAVVMTMIVALRYLASSGFFAWLTKRLFPGRLEGQAAQVRAEIRYSLASAAIYGVPAGIVAWGWQHQGWTKIYLYPAAYPLWWMPVSLLIALFIQDTWFYWTHRLFHRPGWYKAVHHVHHLSRPPTAWAAMSFSLLEAISGAIVVPLLVFILPMHAGILGLWLLIMTVMGVTNHMGWEMFPSRLVHGRLGKWVITASHHELHHQKYLCNYGLYFRVWDRLCGTDRGLGTFAPSRAAHRRARADGGGAAARG